MQRHAFFVSCCPKEDSLMISNLPFEYLSQIVCEFTLMFLKSYMWLLLNTDLAQENKNLKP